MNPLITRHSRRLLSTNTIIRNRPSTTGTIRPARRNFGAGQPESQSNKARLWEGHKEGREDWETTVYATYAAATVIITVALGFTPDTSTETVCTLSLFSCFLVF